MLTRMNSTSRRSSRFPGRCAIHYGYVLGLSFRVFWTARKLEEASLELEHPLGAYLSVLHCTQKPMNISSILR